MIMTPDYKQINDYWEKQQMAKERDKRIENLEDALRGLLDVQNGPPLIRERAEWEAAVARAKELLSK